MVDRSDFLRLARGSAEGAGIVAGCVFALIAARVFAGRLLGEQIAVHWLGVARISLGIGVLTFLGFMAHGAATAQNAESAPAKPPRPVRQQSGNVLPLPGFVAMEQVFLLLHRTYVVFIAPEGLYGWCVQGTALHFDPRYFEPYEEVLEDEELAGNHMAVKHLSKQRGGFFLPRAGVAGVELHQRPRHGLERIPHSGCLRVKLAGGGERELVLLGLVSGEAICDCIVSVLALPVGSKQ
jgi:hypothetical protein